VNVTIATSDPESIDTGAIQSAIEALGYFVASVSVQALGSEESK
jgi:hypothetical protein